MTPVIMPGRVVVKVEILDTLKTVSPQALVMIIVEHF